MIEFDEIFCLDLKDDFEEIGRNQNNFKLSDFINGDISRAFAFGYCHLDWIKEKMWFPVSVRKELRHLADGLEDYNAQFKWLNEKYSSNEGKVRLRDYADYILSNIFCEDQETLLKLAIILGTNLRNGSDEE